MEEKIRHLARLEVFFTAKKIFNRLYDSLAITPDLKHFIFNRAGMTNPEALASELTKALPGLTVVSSKEDSIYFSVPLSDNNLSSKSDSKIQQPETKPSEIVEETKGKTMKINRNVTKPSKIKSKRKTQPKAEKSEKKIVFGGLTARVAAFAAGAHDVDFNKTLKAILKQDKSADKKMIERYIKSGKYHSNKSVYGKLLSKDDLKKYHLI